ncbi:hypothetical protein ACO2FJ_12565 [Staphylococcus warneri]
MPIKQTTASPKGGTTSREQTTVSGHGLPDVPLFQHAPCKVTMDNAHPELKAPQI